MASSAYALALQVRALRMGRGEQPRGFKIGFTNRTIWPRYNVFAPIWGTVWDSTLTFCDGQGGVDLTRCVQPRIEPEVVFGFRQTPPPDASLEDLFHSLDWMAPGFEVVQCHLLDWKFSVADTVLDSGLHARLLVGRRTPVRTLASSAAALQAMLAENEVSLLRQGALVERGSGTNVLGDPLQALMHFVRELRSCPDAPDVSPLDVVTTGTWTDAWPVSPAQTWQADFSSVLPSLTVTFK